MGFGQLDEQSALYLADIAAAFPKRSAKAYNRMLLVCFANLYYKGKVPYFNLGYRELAKRCGCSHKTARRFLKYLEDDEQIIELGTESVSRMGKFTKRTFWWLAEDMGEPQKGRTGEPLNDPTVGRYPEDMTPPVRSLDGTYDPTSEAELHRERSAMRSLYESAAGASSEEDSFDEDGNLMMPWEVDAE